MWTSATDQSRFVHLECSAPLFQDSYKRNNKSSGNKHLRCFPHCCKAHNASGYCGSTLQVLTAVEHADMMLFAKFDLEQAADDIQVSSVVHVSEFEKSPYLRGRRLPDPSPGHVSSTHSPVIKQTHSDTAASGARRPRDAGPPDESDVPKEKSHIGHAILLPASRTAS
ncbi:hypothetical protein DYB34_012198 [Aphanomyces astaci]|uniref:Uncharacterized protein n=1 Tax=Aphanomyces astaci TaxID=112090 RepID=A0A418BHU6_APHAT|nr:hypothetical protein DYB34_012198 [Aphanomyces astaci]